MSERSLLVVDDVPEILAFFEQVARHHAAHQVEIVTLNEAEDALILVRTRHFDVIVSDFRMPRVDGLQLLAAARAHNPRGRRVLMTGYNEVPASPAGFAKAGLDARIGKPVTASFLSKFLQACFSDDREALEAYRTDQGA